MNRKERLSRAKNFQAEPEGPTGLKLQERPVECMLYHNLFHNKAVIQFVLINTIEQKLH